MQIFKLDLSQGLIINFQNDIKFDTRMDIRDSF